MKNDTPQLVREAQRIQWVALVTFEDIDRMHQEKAA